MYATIFLNSRGSATRQDDDWRPELTRQIANAASKQLRLWNAVFISSFSSLFPPLTTSQLWWLSGLWMIRKIIRTVLCCTVYDDCAQHPFFYFWKRCYTLLIRVFPLLILQIQILPVITHSVCLSTCGIRGRPFCFAAVCAVFFFFRTLSSVMTARNSTKLRHMFVQNLSIPRSPITQRPKNCPHFKWFYDDDDLSANIFGMKQATKNKKKAFNNKGSLAQNIFEIQNMLWERQWLIYASLQIWYSSIRSTMRTRRQNIDSPCPPPKKNGRKNLLNHQ